MFQNIYKDKVVLITGNTGFKGSWLTCWLLSLGAKVVGLSLDIPTSPSMFEALGLENKIEHYFEDIRNQKAVSEIILKHKPDFLFHLAAQPIVSQSYADPVETIQTNIIGTANILEALRTTNHKCTAVLITSDKCYENVEWIWGYREDDRLGGKDPYSASKAGAEIVIYTYFHSFFSDENSVVRLASTRAGNVVGGGDWADSRIVPDTIRAWAEEKSVTIRRPNATRPWQHVLEPLSGYLTTGQLLFESPLLSGESFNFGPAADQTFTVKEVLETLGKNWKFETAFEKVIVQEEKGFHEAGLLKLNCDKALGKLRWKPVLNFDETMTFTSDWYFNYYKNDSVNLYDFTLSQLENYTEKAKAANIEWTN